jgi:dipeptidyl aminopeptidase/acylaminoacyl peptidase
MIIPRAVLVFAFASMSGFALAQQTGTMSGRTPGSAVGAQISSTKVTPKATCEAPASSVANGEIPLIPEMVFSRKWGELVCIRHSDGRTEELRGGTPWGAVSGNGSEAAYFVPEKRELHVFSIATRTDAIVDVLPGTKKVSGMFWSVKGRSLVYRLEGETRVQVLDLITGKTNVVEGGATRIVAAPDPTHLLGIGRDGAELISIDGGKRELTAAVKDADRGQYSQSGALLGILGSASLADQAAAAAAPASTVVTEDDSPDCTGGTFALIVQEGNELLDIPFPEGFDSVLDFQFSPDDSAIAVTFGVAGCDYPGERARVYVVSLPAVRLMPTSPADRMSVEPRWTPDGKTLVYVDYRGSDSPLVAFDLQTRKATPLTSPGQFFGPDTWLAWR